MKQRLSIALFEKVWVMAHHCLPNTMGSTVPRLRSGKLTHAPASVDQGGTKPLRFEEVYAEWMDEICRWVRAFGGLDADLDDLAQEVFIVVRRKLPEFDGVNLAGWMYRITQRTVRDYRRRTWFRRFLFMRHSDPIEDQPSQLLTPAEWLERREAEHLLAEILKNMTERRRTAFILFEIEGYSGEEIAELENVSVNTVWTRLYHARKDFLSLIARAREKERTP
jgi:RNA polymerase sigma-70 factor, ECF subfamily